MSQGRDALLMLAAALMLLTACSKAPAPAAPASTTEPAAAGTETPAADQPDFVGKTWRVIESTAVVVDTRYGFRSDGTMTIISPGSLPAAAKWEREADHLVWIEEGQRYRVEVRELGADILRVRVFSPGDPLDIAMVPVQPPQQP